jgi:hypothetical protein
MEEEKAGGNGNGASGQVEQTAAVAEGEEGAGGATFQFKGKNPLTQKTFEKALANPEQFNGIKYLVETGDAPRDLFMRTLIPDRMSNGYRLLIALQTELEKCLEFGDTEGAESVRDILALLPSVNGVGRQQLVASFIGGYMGEGSGTGGGEDLTSRLKKIALGGR